MAVLLNIWDDDPVGSSGHGRHGGQDDQKQRKEVSTHDCSTNGKTVKGRKAKDKGIDEGEGGQRKLEGWMWCRIQCFDEVFIVAPRIEEARPDPSPPPFRSTDPDRPSLVSRLVSLFRSSPSCSDEQHRRPGSKVRPATCVRRRPVAGDRREATLVRRRLFFLFFPRSTSSPLLSPALRLPFQRGRPAPATNSRWASGVGSTKPPPSRSSSSSSSFLLPHSRQLGFSWQNWGLFQRAAQSSGLVVMASIGTVMAKVRFSNERGTIYSSSTCSYSGLLASKKRLSLCPAGMDRSLVFSAISARHQSQRSFAQPNFFIKQYPRRTNAVNQDSTDNQSSHMEEPKNIEKSNKENDTFPVDDLSQAKKRSAKIHDFCFGIPFGGIVLGAGLVGFLLSGSRTTLMNGLLFGGALLALSSYSLKVWRQGKSCLPFILGQSVLAVALLVKQFQIYALTKNLFPTRLYIITSAGMLCFYLYVLLSGGNPPPKKLKVGTSISS